MIRGNRLWRGIQWSILIGVIGSSGIGAAGWLSGIRFNQTDSVPIGLWRVDNQAVAKRGDTVLLCPPPIEDIREAHRAGYISNGFCPGGIKSLLKPIAAVEGDRVAFSDEGLRVNGHLVPNSAPVKIDGYGRRLPRLMQGEGIVADGQVWFVSDYNPGSFDSRYFGPLPATSIVGVATPLLVKDEECSTQLWRCVRPMFRPQRWLRSFVWSRLETQ